MTAKITNAEELFDKWWEDNKKESGVESSLDAKIGFFAAIEIINSSEEKDRQEHQELMATNPDYAKRFAMISIPEGKKFTVAFECVDTYKSNEFFASMFGGTGFLVAGCKVITIGFNDIFDRHNNLKQELTQLLDKYR
jgi:hypothetical protein